MNNSYNITTIIATQKLAYQIASQAKINDIFFLFGEVGSGKSTFVSYFLEYYNFIYSGSPTFNLVHEYKNNQCKIIHSDCYRVDNILPDFLDIQDAIVIIEWPNDKIQQFFLKNMSLFFKLENNTRVCCIK